ncbi:n-alpha-acetyltransferase 60 [Stylonychia lemnae]|uniref:N-alpha-acetyltransferase 60 n=1 Tax=Stylonychia lemnae TaxID=5949 RepID=A0A078AAA0_STYLE|nr:n-alpha-acetyltransferase 60 [Stylonychia lemnae]|eukprot:CDW78806.1 n-alpha-acetyltransferase 60 [Stylonychia lemnae]
MTQYLKKKIKSKKKNNNVIQYKELEEDNDGNEFENGIGEKSTEFQDESEDSSLYGQEQLIYGSDPSLIMNMAGNGNGQRQKSYASSSSNNGLFQNIDISDSKFEEQKAEKFDPNRILVESDAWPEEQEVQVKSKIHKLLRREMTQIDPSKIYFSQIKSKHLKELRYLHEEWFPLNYPDTFYDKITKNKVIAIGCFIDLDAQNKNVILGCALVKINSNNEDITEMYTAKDYYSGGIFNWFKTTLTCREYQAAYIMTIGVVDECRRMGLGTMLLREIIKILNQQITACEVIYLHVVDYNETAIKFYEKNDFRVLKRVKSHYVIFDKTYDGLLLYKDIKVDQSNESHDDESNLQPAKSEGETLQNSEQVNAKGILSYIKYPFEFVYQRVLQNSQQNQ